MRQDSEPQPSIKGLVGKARARAINQVIAQRLRAARNVAGLSQQDAAAMLDLTFQQLQKYEKGTNRISPGSLAVLADRYGVGINYFFDGVTEGQTPRVDYAAQLMSLPYGVDVARDYVRIPNLHRRVVADVARSLADKVHAQ
jgi:transcriptional regulator with XRE-family HTH domain